MKEPGNTIWYVAGLIVGLLLGLIISHSYYKADIEFARMIRQMWEQPHE